MLINNIDASNKTLSLVLLSHIHFSGITKLLLSNHIAIVASTDTSSSEYCPTATIMFRIKSNMSCIDICNAIYYYCATNKINYYSVICQDYYAQAYLQSNIHLGYLADFKPKRKIGFNHDDIKHLRLIQGSKIDPLEVS
jgi:hypothetical protein